MTISSILGVSFLHVSSPLTRLTCYRSLASNSNHPMILIIYSLNSMLVPPPILCLFRSIDLWCIDTRPWTLLFNADPAFLPCSLSSWNSGDHNGQAFSIVSFLSSCLLVPPASFQLGLLHVFHPSISIIPFSNPSGRITCPKNLSFLLSAVCCSVIFYSNLHTYIFISLFLRPWNSLHLPPYPHYIS